MDNANVEHTHGFWRRVLVIPFTKTFPDEEQDRDLHKKILQDRAGVLNWIIDGAKRVIESRDIFVSSECEDFKKKFIKETDSVAMYEADFLESKQPVNYINTVTEAYIQYKNFCLEAGHKYPLNRNNFTERMQLLGFIKSRKNDAIYLQKNY